MAINCGAGWQRDSIVEALGKPDEDVHQPDPAAPGVNLHIIRWRCSNQGLVSAVKAPYDSGYAVETSCTHPEHNDLALLPQTRVHDVVLVDASGAPLTRVPKDLKGVRLRFKLTSSARAYARVEVAPDMNTGLPKRIIEVDGDTFGPGTASFDLPLTAVDTLDAPLHREVELSIHVLDPKTAVRDRNADGICLWSQDYYV